MYEDPLIGEDVWVLKIGESIGDFRFSVKMVNLVQGFTKLKYEMDDDCFRNEQICSSELALMRTHVCYDCSEVSVLEISRWDCLSSVPSNVTDLLVERGTILYPKLKMGCSEY